MFWVTWKTGLNWFIKRFNFRFLTQITVFFYQKFQNFNVLFSKCSHYETIPNFVVGQTVGPNHNFILRKSGQFSISYLLMADFLKIAIFAWWENMFLIGFYFMLSLFVFPIFFFENVLKWKIHIFEKISIFSRDIHSNYIFRNGSRRAPTELKLAFYLDTLSFNSFQTT